MTGRTQKLDTFNFRVEPELKAAFAAATEASDRPAAQVLREFMRHYVRRRERLDARRSALRLAARAQDPGSDEARILRELDANLDEFLRTERE